MAEKVDQTEGLHETAHKGSSSHSRDGKKERLHTAQVDSAKTPGHVSDRQVEEDHVLWPPLQTPSSDIPFSLKTAPS